jgi:transcriptional regulator with XRE-family HTH domain
MNFLVYFCNKINFMANTEVNNRVKAIADHYLISTSRLAEELDVSVANVSHIFSGRNKPGFDFIEKLLDRFPDVNAEWIMRGKGSMLRMDEPPAEQVKELKEETKKENVPPAFQTKEETVPLYGKIPAIDPPSGDKIVKIILIYENNTFNEILPR